MKLLYRPGWRLRCVDPQIAWLQLSDDHPPALTIRLQLTCYLTSRRARFVWLHDAQLRIVDGDRTFIVPMDTVTDIDGDPFGADVGFEVDHEEPKHALVYFVADTPDLISLLSVPGPAVAIDVEALLNDALEHRKIADFELAHSETLLPGDNWQQVDTGRP